MRPHEFTRTLAYLEDPTFERPHCSRLRALARDYRELHGWGYPEARAARLGMRVAQALSDPTLEAMTNDERRHIRGRIKRIEKLVGFAVRALEQAEGVARRAVEDKGEVGTPYLYHRKITPGEYDDSLERQTRREKRGEE